METRTPHSPLEARVARLEGQVETLTEALRALAGGLAGPPGGAAREDRAASGARLAHELLLLPGAAEPRPGEAPRPEP